MNKPTIKVGFTDYFNPFDEFITDILSHDFEIVRNDNDPDYLFFCDENFGQNNLNYDSNRMVKIFYTGENRRPYNYKAHYAVSFDHIDLPQFFRLPLYSLENWVNQNKLGWCNLLDFKRTMRAKDKEGFCSFVVRNHRCSERNEFFHLLSQYKTVDSGGPLFNNVGGPIPQESFNSHVTKTEFIKKRKFHIAYENSSYPGYVTEKILHGFLGESIPIYWGSPCVEMDFNHKAFISRHNFKSTEDMIEFIKYVDQNDDVYDEIMSQPVLPSYNTDRFLNFDNFRYWFKERVYKK